MVLPSVYVIGNRPEEVPNDQSFSCMLFLLEKIPGDF